MERAGAHMHVASTIIFEGSAPSHARVPRPHRLAPAPGPALPPEAALRPLRPGPPGLGRRPLPQPRLPRAPDRAAGARLRGAAAQPRGADLLPAARPHQAALGAVAGRGPRRRPLRDRRQEPPRARRRRLRRRHHHGPLRPRARAGRTAGAAAEVGAAPGADRPGAARRRPARAGHQPARDRPRRARGPARAAPGPARDRRHRQDARRRHGRALHALQRRDRPAPPHRLRPHRPRPS